MRINKQRGRLLAELALDGVQDPVEAQITIIYAYTWIKLSNELDRLPSDVLNQIQAEVTKTLEEEAKK